MKTPVLETSRLILRPFQREDAQTVLDTWESDPDVAKYMFWTSHNDIEKTKAWLALEIGRIDRPDWYRFAVERKGAGQELIGTVLIYDEEEVHSWEIGYNFGKRYWGQGYATEAVRCVLDFARTKLGVREVVGRYAKDNPASGRVMAKLGFQWEKEIPFACNDGAVVRPGVQCRLRAPGTDVDQSKERRGRI